MLPSFPSFHIGTDCRLPSILLEHKSRDSLEGFSCLSHPKKPAKEVFNKSKHVVMTFIRGHFFRFLKKSMLS